MNFALVDSSPTPTPSSGCCAHITDGGSPGQASMKLGGTAGTSSTSVSVANRNSFTYLYYIGTPGDFSGLTINAGTWTVNLYLTGVTGTSILDSIYICQAHSSGTSFGTLANSTGLLTTLNANLNSFSVTQSSASSVFGSTDVVIISFQIHGNPSGSFSVDHSQTTVSAPGTPPAVAGKPPPPLVVRSDFSQEAITWLDKPKPVIIPPPVAGPVMRPRVISFPEGFPTGSPDRPFAGSFWRPTTLPVTPYGTPGWRILFNRGPAHDIPIHSMGEPSWTIDTFQMFVGDSFANHFVGGEPVSVPVSSSSPGYPGQWAWDGTYFYACVSNGVWRRTAMSSF